MITPKVKTAFLVALNAGVLAASLAVSVPNIHAQAPTRAAASDAAEDKRWLAVAPGRVEPLSGIIRVAVPVMGVIGEVLVKANDKVFAGEPLVQLVDPEVRARLVAAEAQVALRKRVRNKESAASGAAPCTSSCATWSIDCSCARDSKRIACLPRSTNCIFCSAPWKGTRRENISLPIWRP